MQIELDTNLDHQGAKLKVIGVGGAGGNAINNMIKSKLEGVGFIVANTDAQALEHNLASTKIKLGPNTTKGLGAGARPEIGEKATEESIDEIKKALEGADMVFVTAGMGGGTGTGGAHIVAEVARKEGALVVGIVTRPFKHEGRKRTKVAEEGIKKLRNSVDALIVIPNQRVLEIIDRNTSAPEALLKVDEVLLNSTKGVSDIIWRHGLINVDFADVVTVMKDMGDALMGIGVATGDDRAKKATEMALNSPLLDGISIQGAKGVLVNITAADTIAMHEIQESADIIEQAVGEDAEIINGVVYDNELGDQIMVTVVATGFSAENEAKKNDVEPVHYEPQPLPFAAINASSKSMKKTDTQIKKDTRIKLGGGINTVNSMFNNGFSAADKNQAPRGSHELKSFDIPAFERRQMTKNGTHKEIRSEKY